MQLQKTISSAAKKRSIPLIIEQHSLDYSGLPFITLIQYRKVPMLTIVDNMTDEIIHAYILDLCGPEELDEEMILEISSNWYETQRMNFPISVEFSKRGLTPDLSKIYRALKVEFVSRVIGPVPIYPMNITKSVKRRKRRSIPEGIELSESIYS